MSSAEPENTGSSSQKAFQNAVESYNGAVREGYQWSQTINELEAYVTVPEYILKSKQLRVEVTATSISVTAAIVNAATNAASWETLVKGDLPWKTNKLESLWTLEPGKHVQIHLEKVQERWWENLLVGEPTINLKLIDASRPMEDLPEHDQMKIAELVWQDEQKKRPTTSNNLESVLKDAWDLKGSPFKGTPYDPSCVQFQNNASQDAQHLQQWLKK